MKQMDKNRVSLLPVRASHLATLEGLLPIHRDPFDRMLVAQATAEEMVLLSDDAVIRIYMTSAI